MVDCYLTSSEGYGLETPRRCVPIRRLRGQVRDDYLLAFIDPPIIGQSYGLGSRDIDQVILATRHQGASLFPIVNWPVYVHVAYLLLSPKGNSVINDDEIKLIAWAELYPTEQSARNKSIE